MGQEIERKFLVNNDSWRAQVERAQTLRQGYISSDNNAAIRIRIAGNNAYLTIKDAKPGRVRSEFEYAIPLSDGETLLSQLCRDTLEKTRHWLSYAGHTWEIDVFSGANNGLIMAEVELEHIEQSVELPSWVGKEVTDQRCYYNAELARNPFQSWDKPPNLSPNDRTS